MTPRYEAPARDRSGSDQDLLSELRRIDSRPYGFYKDVRGTWDYGDFTLAIDHIQADPYAPPSSLRAWSSPAAMGLPPEALASSDARLATADFLAREFDSAIRASGNRDVRIARAGVEILARSYSTVLPDRVEVRFQVQLPARGRTILGRSAARLFDVDVPNIVMDCFDFVSDDATTAAKLARLKAHIACYEDYRALQSALEENNWVAFVADGSLLARRSGISQAPLLGEGVIPFTSPDSLRATVSLPHAGEVSGMAITPGITLIVGGGYHGKSTLLGALALGVYAHVPGDGRELVATTPDAMKVRAADGRAITGVDISPFISHLPGGADTTSFDTENASGSTSQAASIVEALELGSPALLIDEDTSATNLLIRDTRMRELVHSDKEPITPLVDRVVSLASSGVSLIMVMGGSGAFLDAADRVLMMDHYRCVDVTDQARRVVSEAPRPRTDLESHWGRAPRIPASKERADRPRTKASDTRDITLDRTTIDISDIEQITESGQAEAIAWMLRGLLEDFAGKQPLPDLLAKMRRRVASEGLDAIVKFGARPYPASLAMPRMVDVGAALNRYRGLSVRHENAPAPRWDSPEETNKPEDE